MKKIYYSNIENGEKSFREIILMVEFFFLWKFYLLLTFVFAKIIWIAFTYYLIGEENLLFVEYTFVREF